MNSLVGNSLRVVLGALVVYSCAGKSISRTGGDGDDDQPPTADDGGFTGGRPGAGGSLIGGTGGTTGQGGTTIGKGGGGTGGTIITGGVSGRGGSPGKGGAPGRGGVGGTGGTAGTSGLGGTSGVSGDGGFGGEETCLPNREAEAYQPQCNEATSCISLLRARPAFIRRNQSAAQPPGDGGAGGDSGDPLERMASAELCDLAGSSGFLAFDYFAPVDPSQPNWALLVSGTVACQGDVIGRAGFLDFAPPRSGTWTTQCLEVFASDLFQSGIQDDTRRFDYVSIDVPPWAMVRNLRFVTDCECPRQLTRYTTCGPITSPRYCLL